MSFKKLKLLSSYNSTKQDIVKNFFEPVLSEAISYDRIAGSFNTESLILAAKGLKCFINHENKMRLFCGVQLPENDLNSIKNTSELYELIASEFINNLQNVEDRFEKNYLKVLAWMINNNLLEIKIGILKNKQKYVGGMLHETTGILKDKQENVITFSGHNYETSYVRTISGYVNPEKFKVFTSWEDDKFIVDEILDFEEKWNNENHFLEVLDIPESAKNKLIELSPKSYYEVMRLPLDEEEEVHNSFELRDYQSNAINDWINNGKRGILEMATGSGKTFTAINCILQALKENTNLLIVIACPYAHLVEQWKNVVELLVDSRLYDIYGTVNSNWKKDLSSLVLKLNQSFFDNAIIFTTHNTFSSEFFTQKLSQVSVDTFLIVDEVHHVVSKSFSGGLLPSYDLRLGLSATPYVYNNEEGTHYLLDYFEGVVHTFTLEDGLTKIDKETDETFLAPYDYFPVKVELDDDELDEYFELSMKIAQLYNILEDNPTKEDKEKYYNLLRKRKRIINNANSKYVALKGILNHYKEIDHLIIFCSPQQINNVLKILNEERIRSHKFTQAESMKKKKQFGGISQREYLVKKFANGYYKALVAIKCLDEGVDIPSADKVIIMSSSNNPREYQQRRGRVLRRYEGKEKSEIYDLTVIQKDDGKLVEGILKSEKPRLLDFIFTAKNKDYNVKLLKQWGIL